MSAFVPALSSLLASLDPSFLNIDVDVSLFEWARAWTAHVVADREASYDTDIYTDRARGPTAAYWRTELVARVDAMFERATYEPALDAHVRRFRSALAALVHLAPGTEPESDAAARAVDYELATLLRVLEAQTPNVYAPRLQLLASLRLSSVDGAQLRTAAVATNAHRVHAHYMYGSSGGAMTATPQTVIGHAQSLAQYRLALEHAGAVLAVVYARLEGALASYTGAATRSKRVR